jgi:hypothetical protein
MQGMNEDLSNDENFRDGAEEKGLTDQFFRAGYYWKGIALKPYTVGTDWLFSQILDPDDAPFTIFLEFIFIHTLDEAKAIDLCWKKPEFRLAMLKWLNSLDSPISNDDKIAAMELFEDARQWARKSSVEVIPDDSQKKREATIQVQSPV